MIRISRYMGDLCMSIINKIVNKSGGSAYSIPYIVNLMERRAFKSIDKVSYMNDEIVFAYNEPKGIDSDIPFFKCVVKRDGTYKFCFSLHDDIGSHLETEGLEDFTNEVQFARNCKVFGRQAQALCHFRNRK